jgi:hypothetical protein
MPVARIGSLPFSPLCRFQFITFTLINVLARSLPPATMYTHVLQHLTGCTFYQSNRRYVVL